MTAEPVEGRSHAACLPVWGQMKEWEHFLEEKDVMVQNQPRIIIKKTPQTLTAQLFSLFYYMTIQCLPSNATDRLAKESTGNLFFLKKICKRINSQHLYSYKHTELTIWSVPLGAREPTCQTFEERSTCCSADGLQEKKQFDILISSGRLVRKTDPRLSPTQRPFQVKRFAPPPL